MYFCGKFKPQHISCTVGTIRRSNTFFFCLVTTLGDNITRVIFGRELNGVGKTGRWLVSDMLEKLLFEEFAFDHPYLLRLHLIIKTLAAENKSVRRAVIDKLMEWRRDPDNIANHVWLVNHFKQYISDNDIEFINMLIDEIKIYFILSGEINAYQKQIEVIAITSEMI